VAPPIIIQRLLIPHLDELHARYPGIELVFRVRTSLSRQNSETDAEIFFSSGRDPPPQAQWLTGDRFCVVAHPAMAPQELPMSEITRYPLLRHSKVERAWMDLAQHVGLQLSRARIHDYEQYSLIIDAAIQRLGVAIIPSFLVQDAFREERLHRIGDEIVFPDMGFYYQLHRREKVAISRKVFALVKEVVARLEKISIPNGNG
jgi:LysR family glycine cleavage system transcriptional activator